MSISNTLPGAPLSIMAQAIKALYHVAGGINEFIDDHIEKLKTSESPLIASTGRVLEAAKLGFGVGYMSSVAIIAAGQYLLGFTFAAVTTIGTAATLSNPIAMTCAALGAIYYGWNALTDKERAQILVRLSDGLAMGIELLRSLVEFVIRKSKDLMTSSQLDDVKEYVKAQAASFGKSLYDITHKVGDLVKDGVESAGEFLGRAGDVVSGAAGGVYDSTTEVGGKLVNAIRKTVQRGEPEELPVAGSSAALAPMTPESESRAQPSEASSPPKPAS